MVMYYINCKKNTANENQEKWTFIKIQVPHYAVFNNLNIIWNG